MTAVRWRSGRFPIGRNWNKNDFLSWDLNIPDNVLTHQLPVLCSRGQCGLTHPFRQFQELTDSQLKTNSQCGGIRYQAYTAQFDEDCGGIRYSCCRQLLTTYQHSSLLLSAALTGRTYCIVDRSYQIEFKWNSISTDIYITSYFVVSLISVIPSITYEATFIKLTRWTKSCCADFSSVLKAFHNKLFVWSFSEAACFDKIGDSYLSLQPSAAILSRPALPHSKMSKIEDSLSHRDLQKNKFLEF